ncbi:integrase, catalytic region, zinc finger, CCHC-type containing protein [Tanacetum coccineum]
MQGSDISQQERHSRLMNEFDKFVAVEGESLTYVYERFSTLINVMDRNQVHRLAIAANTMFLNSLQPEWSKYVTMTRQQYILKTEEYDALFDHLSQFEPHVNASKAKKAIRNHDPLVLVTNSHTHSLNSHASSTYSRSPQPYYITHLSLVIDNDDDYQGKIQGEAQKDKLTTAMILLARAITQCYSTPTNNRLRSSSNTRNQAVVQDGRVDIQSKNVGYAGNGNKNVGRQNMNQCYNFNEKGHYARECPKPRVPDAKYFREQMLLALKDEAGAHLDDEENDFMLDNAYGDNTLDKVNASQVDMINGSLSKSDHEQHHHEKLETIIHTSADDQINSDIIFDNPYVDNNSGQVEHDTNAHDQCLHDFESLIINVQVEAGKQRKKNIELQKQKALLQRELETCKERVKEFEKKPEQPLGYKEAYEELKNVINVEKEQHLNEKEEIREELLKKQDETLKIKRETDFYKKAFKERENKYLEDIISLKKNSDLMIE